MTSRNRTLHFAVTGTLLALAPIAPVESCLSAAHPDHDPAAPTDRLSAEEPGPVVNPGPVPSGD